MMDARIIWVGVAALILAMLCFQDALEAESSSLCSALELPSGGFNITCTTEQCSVIYNKSCSTSIGFDSTESCKCPNGANTGCNGTWENTADSGDPPLFEFVCGGDCSAGSCSKIGLQCACV